MKKLFVSALAIIGLVACAKDDVVSVQDNRSAIGFDTFVENVTRVGYTTDNLDGFDVWAYMGDTRILNDEDVKKVDGAYTYGNTQYWIPGQDYFFAALAPLNLNLVDNVNNVSNEGLGEITFTNVDGTKDLIYSTYSVTADGSQDKVNFQFNHLLSKVKFSFVNAFDNANYTFTVSNIEMTAPESASIDLTANGYTWYDHAGNIDLTFGVSQTEPASKGNTFSSDDLLTIPAGDTQKYNVTFDVNLYVAGTLARTYNKEAKISGIEFVAGKGYSLTATINADTFNLEDINFDATVEDWDDTSAPAYEPYKVEVAGVSYDNLAEACGVAMDSNNPVNFFQHVVVDADNTITVPAGKTLTLNLNGYTLTGVTRDADKNDDGSLTSADNEVMFDVRGIMNVNGAPISRASAAENGTISVKHIHTNFGWNACTEIFYIGFGGTLNVENATLENHGGSDMAYAIDMVNATDGITLKVENSTIKSTYIPVRVFNNGSGMNNVEIKNSTLKGGSRAFWVHIYTQADDSSFFAKGKDTNGNNYKDETLNINIYNPTCNNTFIANDPNRIIEYGFTNEINFDENGMKAGSLDDYDDFLEALSDDTWYDATKTELAIEDVADFAAFIETANSIDNFEGKTIKLANDIDLYFKDCTAMADSDPVTFRPIGDVQYGQEPFKGTFDGQGYTIKNLYQNGWDLGYHWDNYGSYGLFGTLEGATVKNVVIEGSESYIEGGNVAFIAGCAKGDCKFENITINSGVAATYNNRSGGIVGWTGAGNYTFKNITLGEDVVLAGLWGSFDSSIGGLVGSAQTSATYNFENVTINCRIDAYNDCTASYDHYNYRMCGMIVGRCVETTTIDGKNYPDLSKYNMTFNNVTVNYGDWMNYHYCRREGQRAVRIEPGYSYGGAENRDHSGDNVNCMDCIPFDQLIGGDQYGVKGLREVNGVTVNYPASYRREVSTATALTEALGKGVSVILDEDIDYGSTQLAITGENQVVDLGGHALTTANNWGGISLKNGATIKNGTITHAGNTAAIKAFNGTSVENVTINATCSTADKTVTGIAVQQGANVASIKNVTINGVSQGIEVGYQATVDLIENAVVNESNNGTAKGIGLVINGGMVGKAKDCTFKGETYGITMHLKGVFDAGLELENCTVEGTTASIYAWDEKGISNTSGSLVLTYDAATTLTGPFVWDFEDECQSVVTLNQPN